MIGQGLNSLCRRGCLLVFVIGVTIHVSNCLNQARARFPKIDCADVCVCVGARSCVRMCVCVRE